MTWVLENRIALVIGAGCAGEGWGNGNAAAVAYAEAGAKVIAVDRDAAAAAATVGLIEQRGHQAMALTADVLDAASIEKAVADTMAAHGRIDILHNNVGMAGMGGPIELAEQDWDGWSTSTSRACS